MKYKKRIRKCKVGKTVENNCVDSKECKIDDKMTPQINLNTIKSDSYFE